MAGELGEMIVRVGTDITGLTRGLADAENRVDAFGAGMQSAGLKIAAVGAAISGAFLAAASAVDEAQDRIRISTGATGGALGKLKADFDAVAASVPSSLNSIAQAVGELNARTGQSGAPLQNLATQVLNLSRLTGTDLSSNIRNSTRIFGDWSIAVSDQTRTLDFLLKTSQATGVGVDALSQKIVQFGAPLRQLGFTFEQSAALLGKFEREGVNAETVLGGLRRSLSQFAEAGVSAPEGLRTLVKEIQALGPGAEASAKAMEVFGTKAGPDMAAAILEGRLSIDALLAQITGSGETIAKASKDTADFGEQFVILRNQAIIALNALAAPALPAFTKLATTAIGIVKELGYWFASWDDGVRNTIVTLSILATGLGTTAVAVGTLTRAWVLLNATMGITAFARIAANFLLMATRIRSVADAVLLLRTAFLTLQAAMGPIGWITLAITALGGLAYAFYRAGESAEDAARRSKAAIDEFAASISALEGLQLRAAAMAAATEADNARQAMRALEQAKRATEQQAARNPSIATLGLPAPLADLLAGRTSVTVKTREYRELEQQLTTAEGKLEAATARFNEIERAEREAADAAEAFRRQMAGAGADLSGLGKGTDETTASIRNLTAATLEFQRLQRVGLFTREGAPEGLRAQFALVEELSGKIHSLQDNLAKLGAAAPASARDLLDSLTSALTTASEELERTLSRMETALRSGVAVTGGPALGWAPQVRGLDTSAEELRRSTQAMAEFERNAARARRETEQLVDALFSLSRVLSPLGSVGRVLGGIAASIADAVDAAARLRNVGGGGVTGVPGITEIAGAVLPLVGAISSFAGIAASVFGGHSEWVETIERNKAALEDLTLEMRGFRLSFGVQANIQEGIAALLRQRDFLENSAGGFLGKPTPVRQKDRAEDILEEFGLTLAELNAAANRFGIDLYDDKGRLILGAVEQLGEALKLSALSVTNFASTIEGQRKLMDARNEIFDITDPAALLQGQFDFLEKLAPELLKQFGLANLNLTSETGRAVFEQGLRDLIDALAKGAIDPAMLAGFESVDDFIAYLLEADRALDGFADAANKASESLTNAVEGFKIAAYRFAATEPTPEKPLPPTGPATPTPQPSVPIEISPVSIAAIHIHGAEGEGGLGTYRDFRGTVVHLAEAHPSLRPFADTLPEV